MSTDIDSKEVESVIETVACAYPLIKNDSDFEEVEREIERLMDAKEGTEEFYKLKVFAAAVGEYENKCHPIDFSDIAVE